MATVIISVILLALILLAVRHMIKVKKSGGCVGCPDGKNCHCKSQSCGCGDCASHAAEKK